LDYVSIDFIAQVVFILQHGLIHTDGHCMPYPHSLHRLSTNDWHIATPMDALTPATILLRQLKIY